MKIAPSFRSLLAGCSLFCATGVPVHALTIVPTYDSTITSLPNAAQVESAFAYAASQFQNNFSDPITINITVSTSAGVGLGQSNTSLQTTTYGSLRTALNSRSLNQTNTGAYFSINGGLTNLKVFNNPGNGGDLRDWTSGGSNDAFNAFSGPGVRNDITAVDLQAMDVIGYNLVPEPGTNAALAIGAALLAATVFRARKKSVLTRS